MLSFGDIHATDVTEAFYGDISDRVNNKESFMLAISSNTCVCWEEFHPIIKNYITENHLYCLHTTYNDFKDVASNFGIALTPSTTTFVVFDKGEAKIKLQSSASNKAMKDINEFKKFMEGNVKLPKAYFINEEDVNSIIENKKNAVIYFERSKCGDCTYLNPTILANYTANHKDMNNIYVLDCQPWKELSEHDYQTKKDDFGLSNKNNTKYGYDDGVFPFFSYINNGEYASGAVAFNDTISKQNGKYVVTNSYYSEEKLPNLAYLNESNIKTKVIKGLEIPASDVADNGERISWMQDKAVNYYEPIINAFLDYSLPNVNFLI